MPETEPLPLAVTYDEAARLLSCSADTIRDMVASGELRKVKVRTLARIEVEELRRFLAAGGSASNGHYLTEAVAGA